EFHDAWDIGSTWKGWYQPGLEARYQDECSDPALQTPVTNRFPRSLTSNPYDEAFDTAGVELFRNCPNGGVCRYPEDLPASITPHPAQPWAYADGNAGNVEQFIAWCKDDMKLHKENPDPTNPEDLVNGLIDTYNWGQDIGFQLYAENQPCIDGQPVTSWMTNLMPTYDAQGNMTSEGALATETCAYHDPQTGLTHNFPCKDMTMNMMRVWGCLDRSKNLWSGSLWDEFSELRHSTSPDGTPHEWLDVDLTFWPTPGSPLAQEYDPAMMKTVYRLYFDFGLPWGLNTLVGQRWLETVSTCFDDRYLDPAETKCECTTNADCDESKGETCGPDGGCLVPSTNALGMTSWKVKECPIVSIVVEVGQCCGDGVVQSTPVQVVGPAAPGSAEFTTHHCDLPASADDPVCAGLWYVEECDAGPDGSATCTPGCKLKAAAPTGACCAPGACFENLDAATCKERHAGTYYPGTTCAALDYCESPPETRAACCLPSGSCSVIVAAECARAQGVWHAGLTCQQVKCTANVSGACCVGEQCQTYPSANICSEKGGVWLAAQSCSTTSVCQRKSACCLPNGTCNDLPPGICHQKGGTSTPGQLCSQVTCPGPVGGCGGLPVSVSDVISRRPGYKPTGPGIAIDKTTWSPTATGELTLTVTVTDATIGKAPGQLQILVSVDGKPAVQRRDLQPIRLKGLKDGSHTVSARLVTLTGDALGNPQSVAVAQVSAPKACLTAADCPSAGACTTAYCTTGRCQWKKTPNCCVTSDDCRFGLVCDAGQCVACATDTDCNDGNACTTECCSDAGTCYSEVVPGCCKTNADCNDQDGCTADACVQGQCKFTPSSDPLCCDADSDCDSGDPCQPSFCASVTLVAASGTKAKGKLTTLRRCKLGPVVQGCCTTDQACDDGNACTKDQCAQNKCIHASIAGCCTTAKDCDDGNQCTSDFCGSGMCVHKEAPMEPGQTCCNTAKDCDDGDFCTLDVCTTKGACEHIAKKGCCSSDKACDDGDACTVNRCNLATRQCISKDVKGCCTSDSQCADGNACTQNTCDRNVCLVAKIPGCCDVAADCNDGNACTLDSCVFGKCLHTTSKLCCTSNLDCGKLAYCDAGACKPFVQAGQICTQDAACLTGNCLSSCSTPLCAPNGEPAAKWLWNFDTLDGFTADPNSETTLSLTAPGAFGSIGAFALEGGGQTAILHTATDFRVLTMVTGSLDQPKLDPAAAATIDAIADSLEAAKGIIELQLYGSDGWVIVRRDVPNSVGATTLLDGGWSRHLMEAVKAGTYGLSVPKPAVPTIRLAVSGPKTITLDNLRLVIPALLPKACCETDEQCGLGTACADGACVPM
ncbi:MAG: hypothetical protein IV100_00310, partial [Myxococcales bacterium]|nr:hypothetical protein [Myxococcales bacterium]